MKHLNIIIKGKVQGVWFRKSTNETAQTIGVKGFVKNKSDGSVYTEVEGTDEQLKLFLEWCNIGPENAVVTDVIIEEASLVNFKTFKPLR